MPLKSFPTLPLVSSSAVIAQQTIGKVIVESYEFFVPCDTNIQVHGSHGINFQYDAFMALSVKQGPHHCSVISYKWIEFLFHFLIPSCNWYEACCLPFTFLGYFLTGQKSQPLAFFLIPALASEFRLLQSSRNCKLVYSGAVLLILQVLMKIIPLLEPCL